MPVLVHVSHETPDVTPCHTSPPQGVDQMTRSSGKSAHHAKPHVGPSVVRAQFANFELFERIILLNLDKRLPVEQFEAALSQSAAPPPPLSRAQAERRPGGILRALRDS